MDFEKKEPVYLQIASYILKGIVRKKWKEEQRIPSVREMAVLIKVNPNTVVRSYNYLQAKDIIYNQSGIGYFVKPGIFEKVQEIVREDFKKKFIPRITEMLELLQMSPQELADLLKQH